MTLPVRGLALRTCPNSPHRPHMDVRQPVELQGRLHGPVRKRSGNRVLAITSIDGARSVSSLREAGDVWAGTFQKERLRPHRVTRPRSTTQAIGSCPRIRAAKPRSPLQAMSMCSWSTLRCGWSPQFSSSPTTSMRRCPARRSNQERASHPLGPGRDDLQEDEHGSSEVVHREPPSTGWSSPERPVLSPRGPKLS